MLLKNFFDNEYRPNRLLGKSPETIRHYNISIRAFGRTLESAPKLTDLTDRNLSKHMQARLDNGKSPGTANKDRCQLSAIWRYACKTGRLQKWPTVPELIEPKRTPQAWLASEFNSLLDATDRREGYFDSVPRSLWWRTILMVCLDTGERINAVRQMEWNWLSSDWLNVPAEARKGRRKDKAYRLSNTTLGHLTAIRFVSSAKPFPWPYCDSYLWTLYGKLLESAGLPSGRKDKFHKIRRTTGSVAYAAGLDPQEVLDHQYRRTTQGYLDPRFTRVQQVSDTTNDFLTLP
jgi:integrase